MRCTMIPAVIALVASVAAALAAPATIEGSWRGSGIVTYRNGADNVQCRVRYTRATAQSFAVSSLCATESGHYELTGRVINVGGNRHTGWVQQGNQSGRLTLVQHGNRLSVTVTSRQGSARLTLATASMPEPTPRRILWDTWRGNRSPPSHVKQAEPIRGGL